MIVMQELAVQNDVKILDLFAEHGAPAGTEEICVSVDGRHVFAIGDHEDLVDWNRSVSCTSRCMPALHTSSRL
jgi:hypothetical protein